MSKNVLFEIGLEELPARFVDSAEKQLADKTAAWLQNMRISYDSISSYSTPRRLAVIISDIAEKQATVEEEAKGPAIKIAKDDSGNWTKAAIGFTKGQGKTLEDIYTKEIKGTTYIFVQKKIEGKSTFDLLPDFKNIIESIQFGKNMRWATETIRYARPIRWLVAMYGNEIIPFEIANVKTDKFTFGHRFLGEKINLEEPMDYQKLLYENRVIVSLKEREQLICNQIKEIENKNNITVPIDPGLLAEVRNLVEYPTAFMGSFDKEYLQLPPEVLISSMKEHQRYFPVKSQNGELLPYFIGVRNGDTHSLDKVVRGNEKVLRARLSDAQFFYEEDQKHTLEFYLDKLKRVVFQEKLGTISDKIERVVHITKELVELLNLDPTTARATIRAAELCKFDLMTNMVNEFTELQGVIGEKYAAIFGEEEIVSKAIGEHYLPKEAHGQLPNTVSGAIVSIADKLDTIVGCISVGLVPTGSQDPYGLRRQAAGVLRILNHNKWELAVEDLLDIAKKLFKDIKVEQEVKPDISATLDEFFRMRATYLMRELEIEQDIVQAVLSDGINIFYYTIDRAAVLAAKRNEKDFKTKEEALVRVLNLAKKSEETVINIEQFQTDSEKQLYHAFLEVNEKFTEFEKRRNAEKALLTLSNLADPIHYFFDNNMVMDDDVKIRNNRLALINQIAELIYRYADLTKVEWKQQF
ncbi:glycine--tRNA ligase subunit beta [Virgibacillus halodenitrificans]|uniref:glycine--tRNA ligase subunit beta n=1 Tax=Virgibacillus halodenitrificans TaxID=1482 RepID=UPI00136C3E7B|nr:glycine--tRNA ligase subunit beta [Virgibacillus halodenitrificans]MYL46607.1 glycine--tRNA ligase subunit beta [Virgibacillus halodenitrificans]